MKTLGVDLASQPKNTGVCVIEWADKKATIIELEGKANDDQILALRDKHQPEAIGIDAPFGWPARFVSLVQHSPAAGLTGPDGPAAIKQELLYRRTDLEVKAVTGKTPLSVAATYLGHVAIRCARLLARMEVRDRCGGNGVYEVYPAAALLAWKPDAVLALPAFPAIVALLLSWVPWLDPGGFAATLKSDRNAFDALICSLVARAAHEGITHLPTGSDIEFAQFEGWIHVPEPGTLPRLAD